MKSYALDTLKELQRELARVRSEFDERDTDPYWMATYREVRQYLLMCLINFRKHNEPTGYDPSA
jgi:hypothetical protein